MTPQDLAVVLGEVHNHVALSVGEGPVLRLGVLPFLCVSGCDLAELAEVAEDGGVGRVVELAVVRRGAEVFHPGRHGQLVELGLSTSGGDQRQSCV